MGEPWSAVTPNKAKENTSAVSHLIDLLAAFSCFHMQAEWYSTWLHGAKRATWPQVRRKTRLSAKTLQHLISTVCNQTVLKFVISIFTLWSFPVMWNEARHCLHPDTAYQSLLHLLFICRGIIPNNLIAISPASRPAGQEEGGWKPASSDCLCLVIYSALAQTGAKPNPLHPHSHSHTPTICQRPGKTQRHMSAIRSHLDKKNFFWPS